MNFLPFLLLPLLATPFIPYDHCQDPIWVNNLVTRLVNSEPPYVRNHYDCTQFSKALVQNLTAYGCTARMAVGWSAPPRTMGRVLHRWVELGNWSIEATPSNKWNVGIIRNMTYQKLYNNAWNLSWACLCD